MTSGWWSTWASRAVYEMNKQSDCSFNGIKSFLLASCKCFNSKNMSSWQLNKWSNTSGVFGTKLSDQRMSYPMAWVRSSLLQPQLTSFYRCSPSPLSSLGVTSSLMSSVTPIIRSYRFWTREVLILCQACGRLVLTCRLTVRWAVKKRIGMQLHVMGCQSSLLIP